MANKYLDLAGLSTFLNKLKAIFATTEQGSKADSAYTHSQSIHAPSNAERNAIVGIQKNGSDIIPDSSRKVNIIVPTKTSELTNDSGYKTTDTTYSNMVGASTSSAGSAGLVPAPAAGAATRYLRSDGTWTTPPNTTYSEATTSDNGLMSSSDKTKLNGIATGAEVNQNAFSNVVVGSTTISADGKTDTLTLAAGSNITLTPDATNDKITIAAKNTTYSTFGAATSSAAGSSGLVPAPAAGENDEYLRGDGTWATPTNTTYSVMTGATASAAGTSGLVPAPTAGNQAKFLRADGTWQTPTNTDTKVTNTLATTTKAFVTGTTSDETNTGTQVFDTGVYLDTTAGQLTATTFKGALSGNASSATKLATARNISITGGATASAVSFNGTGNVALKVTSLDATKLSGTVPIENLPAGALERLVTVTNETARFALTASDVQLGDTVKQNDTGIMYLVVDTSNLDSDAGYEEYTAGSATSVPWSGVTGKPSSYTPSSHTQAISTITGLQDALDGKLSTTGTAAKATALTTSRTIDGVSFNGGANIHHFGTCSTAAATAAKVVSCSGFTLATGARIVVKFTVTNTASSPTLNVNSTGAKNIYYRGSAIGAGYLAANRVYEFVYDGTQYNLVGDLDTNSTYGLSTFGITATAAEINKLDGLTATTTELNYTDGVTSNIQTQLNGKLSTSGTAAKATADASGQTIASTYIKGLSVSGKTITYTKGDGTTGTITTQDTNTDTKATQTNTTTAADYRVVLSTNANDTTETNTLRKSTNFRANPSTGAFYAKGYDRIDISGQTVDIDDYNLSAGSPDIMRYVERTNGGAANITNVPVEDAPFLLDVELIRWASTTDYITMQTFRTPSQKTYEYVRYCTSGTWSGWTTRRFTDTTYSAGTGLSLASNAFSLATSGVTAGSYGPTANVTGSNNTTINVPQITVDSYGRVTSVTNRVYTSKDTNTTYSAMTGATSSAAGSSGLVPAPAAGKQASFLRGDGTWVVPTNTTYSVMTGASASAAGASGLVPAPAAGKQTSFLRGDGTWVVPTNTTYSAATTSAAGLMSAADKSKSDATNVAYGTCATAAATAAKVVTLSGNTNWKLAAGSTITVKFTYTNTASNPTLNVNNTGAKSIVYNTAVLTTSSLSYAGYASRYITYVYDGTNYVFAGWSIDSNTTYSNASLGQGYGTCTTAAATTAKVVTLSSYTLVTGGVVSVKFTYAVPASATLNVNSKGAKSIYHKGAAIKAGVINAGDVATFIYNGSQYHLIAIDSTIGFEVDGTLADTD